jgi:hypothetical protein
MNDNYFGDAYGASDPALQNVAYDPSYHDPSIQGASSQGASGPGSPGGTGGDSGSGGMSGDSTENSYLMAASDVNAILQQMQDMTGGSTPGVQQFISYIQGYRDKISSSYDLAVQQGNEALRVGAANAMVALDQAAQKYAAPGAIKANAVNDVAAQMAGGAGGGLGMVATVLLVVGIVLVVRALRKK